MCKTFAGLLVTVVVFSPVRLRSQDFDDFGDGDFLDGFPVIWEYDPSPGAWPGTYDASSGDLVMFNPDQNLQVIWVNVSGDLSARAQAKSVGPGARDIYFEADTENGYRARITAEGDIALSRYDQGVPNVTDLDTGTLDNYDADADYILQVDVQGEDIEMRVWRPEEKMPEDPQLLAQDATYRGGVVALGYTPGAEESRGIFRYGWVSLFEMITTDPPRAVFSIDPASPLVGADIMLDASESTTGEGHGIASFEWDFGDGETEQGDEAIHSYDHPGRFLITLQITDDRGLVSTLRRAVHVACPPGGDVSEWRATEVGEPEFGGVVARLGDEEGGCLRLCVGGRDIASRADEFHFLHRQVSGDVMLSARIAEITSGENSSQVGVMLRESLEPEARFVGLLIQKSASPRVRFSRREEVGSSVRRNTDPVELPDAWLQLRRQGNEFVGLTSVDGVQWQEVARRSVDLPATLLAGIAACGRDRGGAFEALVTEVCDVELSAKVTPFLRGDCTGNGDLDLTDAVCTLSWLFLGADEPGCLAAANTNGDAGVDLSDAVSVLNFLFLGAAPPVPPYPDCGPGELATDEEQGCDVPPECP